MYSTKGPGRRSCETNNASKLKSQVAAQVSKGMIIDGL